MDFTFVFLLAAQQVTRNLAFVPALFIPERPSGPSADPNRPAEFNGTVVQIVQDNDYFSGTTVQDENIEYVQGLKLLKPITEDANLSVFFTVDFTRNAWKGGGFNICDKPADTFSGTMMKVMKYFFGVEDKDCPINELNIEESLKRVKLNSTQLPEEERWKINSQKITFSVYTVDNNHKGVLIVRGNGAW